MATLKYRLNRKNSSGSYDTIHYETDSTVVVRPNSMSAEEAFFMYDKLFGLSNQNTMINGTEIAENGEGFSCLTQVVNSEYIEQTLTFNNRQFKKGITFNSNMGTITETYEEVY